MKLYSYFRSSCAHRVRIALNLKEIDYDIVAIHLVKDGGQQNAKEYSKLNPMNQVPFLEIDEKNGLAQSVAIVNYIDRTYPVPPLYPANPYQRALVEQFIENFNAGIQPLQNLSVTNALTSMIGASEAQVKDWVKHWISKGMTAAEAILAKHAGKYSFGDQITAADAFLVPQVFSSLRFEVDLKKLTTVCRVFDNCMKHEAFIQADPFHQPDTPADLRK